MTKVKTHKFITILVMAILLLGVGFIQTKMGPAFAEEASESTEASVLEVYNESDLVKAYTAEDLKQMTEATKYVYSAFNSFPSGIKTTDVVGIPLEKLFLDSGFQEIGDDQVIELIGSDGVSETFLKKQLFAERYYYPNFMNEAGRAGKAVLPSSLAGKEVVPAMIRMNESNSKRGRLYFGQQSPSEQNYSHFLKYVKTIIVHDASGLRWNPLRTTSHGVSGAFLCGATITFDRNVNTDPNTFGDRYCIYYTTDGSTPGLTSNLYNYNNFNFGTDKEKFNKVVLSAERPITIKTIVIGYGREDSAVSTFRFVGVKTPAAPTIRKITTKSRAITLKWTRVAGASGYKIYRATKKSGKYKLVKTVRKGSTLTWKNKKLKKNKKYYYKIMAFKKVSGKTFNSRFSAVRYKKVK